MSIGAILEEMTASNLSATTISFAFRANALGTRLVSHAQRDFLAAGEERRSRLFYDLMEALKLHGREGTERVEGGLHSLNSLRALLVPKGELGFRGEADRDIEANLD